MGSSNGACCPRPAAEHATTRANRQPNCATSMQSPSLQPQPAACLQYQLSEREPGSLGEPHSAMFSCANAPVNMPMGCGAGGNRWEKVCLQVV